MPLIATNLITGFLGVPGGPRLGTGQPVGGDTTAVWITYRRDSRVEVFADGSGMDWEGFEAGLLGCLREGGTRMEGSS